MSWSDLEPQVRSAIVAVVVLIGLVLLWVYFVTPMRDRASAAQRDIEMSEAELESMEREIEGVPQATDAERSAWLSTEEELFSRLGPETELPLLIESLVRLAESSGVQMFITSEAAMAVANADGFEPATQTERVLAPIPGVGYVPLNCRIYGDHDATGRLVAQISRLGWVTDIAGLEMRREFPELVSDLRLNVFFRPADRAQGARAVGQGGGDNG